MRDRKPALPERSRLLEIALARWENEGGAVPEPLQAIFTVHRLTIHVPREPIGLDERAGRLGDGQSA